MQLLCVVHSDLFTSILILAKRNKIEPQIQLNFPAGLALTFRIKGLT